jgi:hypothetical protein
MSVNEIGYDSIINNYSDEYRSFSKFEVYEDNDHNELINL